ncbi:MAG: thioredoxin domain-containing protein [Desulfobacteraceae bacterium]|nr:thioredoxin domain-containing protein [Desulfobacteraceae bacterium]
MKKYFFLFIFLCCITLFAGGCNKGLSKEDISRIIRENPDIILDVLKEHPLELLEIEASGRQIKMNQAFAKKREKESKNPIEFETLATRFFKPGSVESAPINITVFSNFQCPYCRNSAKIIDQIVEKYPDKTQVLFRHISMDNLSFQQALLFEAVGLKSQEKAWRLHDFMFQNQDKILKNQGLLKEEIKRIGLNFTEKEIKNDITLSHLKSDNDQARKLHINKTPTIIVNGITVTGRDILKVMIDIIENSI